MRRNKLPRLAKELTMRRQLMRFSVMLVLIAIVVAAIVVTAAGAKSGSRDVTRSRNSADSHVSRRLLAEFKVLHQEEFRGAHNASTSASYQPLPQGVIEGMEQAQPQMEPSSAAFAGGTYPTWVVPGADHVCLVLGTTGANSVPSSSCGSTASAEQHGLAISTENEAGTPVIVGLVPNGNPVVKVTNTNGTSKGVPVVDNVYEVTGGAPRTVTFRDGAGSETTRPVAVIPAPPPPSAPAE
jgi:hypothetical protein